MRAPAAPPSTIDLRHAVAIGTPKAVELWLDVVDDPVERADQLTALTRAEVVRLSELLPVPAAVEIADTLDLHVLVDAVRIVPPRATANMLAELESDRAAEVLRELDAAEREPIVALLDPERAAAMRALLAWPEESAADILDKPPAAVSQHLAKLRWGRIVKSRQEGTRVFYSLVDEHARTLVTQAVFQAQHALGDDPEHHRGSTGSSGSSRSSGSTGSSA